MCIICVLVDMRMFPMRLCLRDSAFKRNLSRHQNIYLDLKSIKLMCMCERIHLQQACPSRAAGSGQAVSGASQGPCAPGSSRRLRCRSVGVSQTARGNSKHESKPEESVKHLSTSLTVVTKSAC